MRWTDPMKATAFSASSEKRSRRLRSVWCTSAASTASPTVCAVTVSRRLVSSTTMSSSATDCSAPRVPRAESYCAIARSAASPCRDIW